MAKQSKGFIAETTDRSRRPAGKEETSPAFFESEERGERSQTSRFEEELEHYRQAVPVRIEEPFDSPEWVFQVVEGGLPLLAVRGERIQLWNGRRRDLARFFPEIVEAVATLPPGTIVDTELTGRSEVEEPHRRLGASDEEIERLSRGSKLLLVIHDLLSWRGADVTGRTLGARRNVLESARDSIEGTRLRLAEEVEEKGTDLHDLAASEHFAAIRAKLKGSSYPLTPSSTWAEIPIDRRDLLIVGGYIDRGSSLSLLCGSCDGSDFVFRRSVPAPLEVRRRLYPLTRRASSFRDPLPWRIGTFWTVPDLVVEVRQGRFIRLRPDLDPGALPRYEGRRGEVRPSGKRSADRARLQKRIRFTA